MNLEEKEYPIHAARVLRYNVSDPSSVNVKFFSKGLSALREREKVIELYVDSFGPHQLKAIVPILMGMGYNEIRCFPEHPEHYTPLRLIYSKVS